MGAEAYGLVGFFSMLQVWFGVLDLGLTPTIARETSRFFGGALSFKDYRILFRSLTVIFVGVALVGGGVMLMLAPLISDGWLQVRELPTSDVVVSVQIMAVTVAMRWMGGLYRGVITGSERLVWLSGFNGVVATLRFVVVLVAMAIWGFEPVVFFIYQLVVAAIELGVLGWMALRLITIPEMKGKGGQWSFVSIKPLLRFSLTIAFTSSIWVFVTQTDKLILSGVLSLSEYAYFTLAVLVASGITIVTGPLSSALLPRLARLHAEGNGAEISKLYNRFAQLVSVVAVSLMVTMAGCSEALLYAWTGDREISIAATPILRLYALGNGLLALSSFPFYLQYARGSLRWHLIGSVLLLVLLIPTTVMAAVKVGAVGSGYVWFTINALYLFGWVAYVHSKIEPGLHKNWIVNNVLIIMLPTGIVGVVLTMMFPSFQYHRGIAFVEVAIFSTFCLSTAVLCSSEARRLMISLVRRRLV